MKRSMAILTIVLLTSSCSSVYRPKAAVPESIFSAPFLADLESPTLLKDYDALPEGPAKAARRNEILWEMIHLTDYAYENYETSFFTGQAFLSTAGDVLNIALDTTAAVTGTAHLKSVLAAISSGVTGSRASYQKNFFDQSTREAIVQVMRAARLTRLSEIESGMQNCATSLLCPTPGAPYTLEQGLLDVTAYYDAGTIIGALITISESSTQQSIAARQLMRQLHRP